MKRLNLIEYNSMIWFLLRASLVGTGIAIILSLSKQDSWISVLIAFILGIIPICLFNFIKKINPDKSIISLNIETLGILGYILNFIMMISAFGFIFMIFWNLINFISTEFLYRTPSFFISFCFMLPILYASFKEFHVISKVSLISFYFVIIFAIFIILGLSKELDIGNLMPIMQNSSMNILKSTFTIFVYNVLPVCLLLIIPENMIKKSSSKSTFIFYAITLLSVLNIVVFIIGCFSTELALLYDYSEFHIFKRFSLGTFIDKVESFLSIEWILGMIVSIIIGVHYLKMALGDMFKLNKKTLNVFSLIICILLVFLSNVLFNNLIEFQNFVANHLIYLLFIGFFICPLITFCIKKRLT